MIYCAVDNKSLRCCCRNSLLGQILNEHVIYTTSKLSDLIANLEYEFLKIKQLALLLLKPGCAINAWLLTEIKKSPSRKRFYRMQYQFECFAKALPWWLVFIQNIWKIIHSRCVASCFLLSCFVNQDCIIGTCENIWWLLCKGSNSEKY